jgi:hypothetical protein
LPIGALTSQVFANLYLDPLDHWIKESLRERWYLRYMDDIVIVAQDRGSLRTRMEQIREFMGDWGLSLNPKTTILPIARGVPFVGYRIWPGGLRVLQPSLRRMRRRLRVLERGFARGLVNATDIRRRIQSWLGHVRHADSASTCAAILSDAVFTRGG